MNTLTPPARDFEHEMALLEAMHGSNYQLMSHFECPVMYALSVINPKWSVPILYELYLHSDPVRFNTLERALSPVTQKELSKRLRELEKVGVIKRTIYPEVPPRVEYSLTESGRAMVSLLNALTQWTIKYGQTAEITDDDPDHEE
jgi:DNA-binding HxlR family transcriptional regulator